MDVKKTAKRSLSALTMLVLATGMLFSDDQNTIISEWGASIQFFPTSDFSTWPGVSGIAPIDVSAASGRVWLIWPECIINLDDNGSTDERTLLTLFSTQSASWGEGQWTPENGTVCSDGYWRGFINLHSEIAQLDLFSGEVMKRVWEEDIPESLYPASDGNLLIFNQGEASLADFNSGKIRLKTNIPPVSVLAVSTEMPLAAWKDGRSNDIHIAGYDAEFIGMHKILSMNPPWSMSWAGRMLVLAYSGKLYAIDKPEEENPVIYKLEDERLPERWYRISGESGRLIIQSPEAGIAAVISVLSTKRSDTDNSNRDFTELLRKSALAAGDKLEVSGYSQQAERYYGWILPYIRESRSRYPLEEIWANLESEITQRRTALR